MLRAWGLCLAGLLGIAFSVAYGQVASSLPEENQWQQGKQYLAEGKAREAKVVLADLAKRYPKEADLHLLLAIASLRLREAQAAELYVRQALAIAPNHAEARTLLGWIDLEIRRDYDAAVQEYTRVVELKPEFPEAYNNLGVALKKKGDLEKAMVNFNRALELRAGYGEARSNRGWVYVEQKRWREAREDFEQALKSDPQDEGALYGLSQVLKEARDYAGAAQALRSLMARSPNFVYWLEWGRLQLVRYYWALLLVTAALIAHAQYKKRVRRQAHGG
ncbi:MAG: tetratricopeptide repeat protein [Deltaproteobacteria bacterium]|nr:tetratricopeptide repeat protein [Deltaproteobacteria bacterium]